MSAKSHPGDGGHGKGCKGQPAGEPHRNLIAVVRGLTRGVRRLRNP